MGKRSDEVVMLSKITTPKTKSELIKSLQSLRHPQIKVIEVMDQGDKSKVSSTFDRMISKGNFTIILIRE